MLGLACDEFGNVYNKAKKLAEENCEKNINLSKEDLSKVASSYKKLSTFFIESYHACFNEKKAIANARGRIIDRAEKLGHAAALKGYTKESAELVTLKERLNLSYQLFCDAFNEGFDNQKLGNPSQSRLGEKHKKDALNKTSKNKLKESVGTTSPKAIPIEAKTAQMPAQKQPRNR